MAVVNPAQVPVGGTHSGHVARHGVHLQLLATGQNGQSEARAHNRHLASACLGLGMPSLRAGQNVEDTSGIGPPPPVFSVGGASAPSVPSPVYASGFAGAPTALRAVPR